ncbi:MAG TPA: general secretion pathway protein GspB [Steroidobacteraceae bacterium]|nr:general secretion pathway protein GspB [Steroidobacteraceae bacterium]
MSFILDALKKSESDRQRQGGPALFEVKVAPPRSALPPWAIAIAVLFAANLGVVMWLLLRHSAAGPTPATASAAAAPAAAAAAPAGAPAAGPAALAKTPAPPPATPPVAEEPAADNEDVPAAIGAADAAGVAAAPHRNGAGPSLNPDDYAPAAEAPAETGSISGRVRRGTEDGVPLYQQLATAPGKQLPQLRLDLHAYADQPADRWVLINMHKLREGDSLPEGVHVDRITPSGAVLSYQGSQFLLTQ